MVRNAVAFYRGTWETANLSKLLKNFLSVGERSIVSIS
jgi:hypothetical protein